MSWSPDLFIGELRPWPDMVHVVRGKTEETRRYVPEEMLFHERDGHDEQFERARSLQAENAKLRELVHFIMHQCNDGNPRCDECIGWNGGECVALQRMREMGVEVDA